MFGTAGILLIMFGICSCVMTTQASTPTSFPTEIIDSKDIPMRLVPAGEFTMGSNHDSDNLNSEHRVSLDTF